MPSPSRQYSPSRAASPSSSLSYAFKPSIRNSGRDSYIKSAHKTHDLVYDLPGMADMVRKGTLKGPKFHAMDGARDSYIKRAHHPTGLFYDLPGMGGGGAMAGSAATATEVTPRGLSSVRVTDFSKGASREAVARGSSPGRAASPNRFHDLHYDVPGMAEEMKRSRLGSAAFRMTSDPARSSYLVKKTAAHDLSYNLPSTILGAEGANNGAAASGSKQAPRDASPISNAVRDVGVSPVLWSTPVKQPNTERPLSARAGGGATAGESSRRCSSAQAGAASFRMTSARFSSPGHLRRDGSVREGARFTVDSYALPGMAESLQQSPHGSLAFRTSTARDSYVKAFPRTQDLHYDIPGMSGVVYHDIHKEPNDGHSTSPHQHPSHHVVGGSCSTPGTTRPNSPMLHRRGSSSLAASPVPSSPTNRPASPSRSQKGLSPYSRLLMPTAATLSRNVAVREEFFHAAVAQEER